LLAFASSLVNVPRRQCEPVIAYTLKRSKRKTLAIKVSGGEVIAYAPLTTSILAIEAFITRKEQWILKHLQASIQEKAAVEISYGDMLYLKGQQYPLVAKEGGHMGFDGQQFYLPPDLSPDEIRANIIKIYQLIAKKDLKSRVLFYSKIMQVMPQHMKISSAKTRWGSCSRRKRVNFSWRLILADEALIDYVVVHELAHLKEMNHSAAFWSVVARVLPDYKERRKQLREFERGLHGKW